MASLGPAVYVVLPPPTIAFCAVPLFLFVRKLRHYEKSPRGQVLGTPPFWWVRIRLSLSHPRRVPGCPAVPVQSPHR